MLAVRGLGGGGDEREWERVVVGGRVGVASLVDGARSVVMKP